MKTDVGLPARVAGLYRHENAASNHFRTSGRAPTPEDVPAWHLYSAKSPNGLELTGDGGAAAGVRCSDVLGATLDVIAEQPSASGRA